MATQSMISLQTDNGYECIYVYGNGNTAGVGQTLADIFNTTDKVIALIALGDCSRIAGVSDLSEVVAYHRDKGEAWEETEPRLCASLEEAMALYSPMYHYVWADEKWTAYKGDDELAWNN